MKKNNSKINEKVWHKMAKLAWDHRKNARILGKTKVGSTVFSKGEMFGGCNIEHKFRSHDIHAEISAISSMVSSGTKKLEAIIIVSKRKKFTPCGGCLDWIFEFGGPKCLVGYQNKEDAKIEIFQAKELMPHYPVE
jgi:cytidine deaminase